MEGDIPNIDINEALREFEEKAKKEEIAEELQVQRETAPADVPGVVKFVMKYSGGAITDERKAEYVVLGFVVVALALSLYLFFSAGSSEPAPIFPLEQVTQ
jgi:hypothetical protein